MQKRKKEQVEGSENPWLLRQCNYGHSLRARVPGSASGRGKGKKERKKNHRTSRIPLSMANSRFLPLPSGAKKRRGEKRRRGKRGGPRPEVFFFSYAPEAAVADPGRGRAKGGRRKGGEGGEKKLSPTAPLTKMSIRPPEKEKKGERKEKRKGENMSIPYTLCRPPYFGEEGEGEKKK